MLLSLILLLVFHPDNLCPSLLISFFSQRFIAERYDLVVNGASLDQQALEEPAARDEKQQRFGSADELVELLGEAHRRIARERSEDESTHGGKPSPQHVTSDGEADPGQGKQQHGR